MSENTELVEPNMNKVIETGKNFTKLKMKVDGLRPAGIMGKIIPGKQYDAAVCELHVDISSEKVTVDMQSKTGAKTHYHKEVTSRDLSYPSIDEAKSTFKVKPDRITVYAYQGR